MKTRGYLTAAAAWFGASEAMVSPNRFEDPELRPHLNKGGLVKRVQPHDAAFPAHNFPQKVRSGRSLSILD